MKKILRDKNNQIVGGVFGGLSENFGIKANFLRFAFLVLLFIIGIIDGYRGMLILLALYLLLMLVIPLKTGPR